MPKQLSVTEELAREEEKDIPWALEKLQGELSEGMQDVPEGQMLDIAARNWGKLKLRADLVTASPYHYFYIKNQLEPGSVSPQVMKAVKRVVK